MPYRWTKREEATMTLYYSTMPWTQLLKLLPNRNRRAIEQKGQRMNLERTLFSTKGGVYFKFALCQIHGRILRSEIVWKGKRLNIPFCPRYLCKKRLRVRPRSSKLREKYRGKKNV